MKHTTIAAILQRTWLIDENAAQNHLGRVIKLSNGDAVDFGLQKDESIEPVCIVIGHGHTGQAGAFAASGVYGVRPSTNLAQLPVGSIAQVDVIGPVLKYGDMCSWGMADIAALVDGLASNGNVAGIILNIDSPGGQASGTALLADSIKAAAQNKPVVAVINDGVAASAAMWIASAASEIWVTKKTDQVGSIGVYTTLADWYKYAKAQGLDIKDVYAPQSTDKNGNYRQALAGNEEPLKKDLAHLATAFIDTIKANRAGKLTSDEWNTGKMFNAKEAAKIGLIDGIKPYPQVIKRVEQLIQTRSNQNQTNMTAFAKTIAITGTTGFTVVDGGFLVTEEQLTAIETNLTENETAITGHQAAVDALNATIQERDATITGLQANDQAATITALQNTIAEKDAEITRLNAKPAGTFTNVPKETADHTGEGRKFKTSYDDEKARLMEAQGK